MTGVDSSELILLLIIGLIVLGPKRLPEIANKVGGWIGQARRMTRVMKRQLEEELSLESKPSINTPSIVPPSVVSEIPDAEDEAQAHVPNEDDTFSPLHDDDSEAEPEKPA
jgi:sec-independent protein translocase protein TatB